jgi:hypothetical protein
MISLTLQICICTLLGTATGVGILAAYYVACFLFLELMKLLGIGDKRLPR